MISIRSKICLPVILMALLLSCSDGSFLGSGSSGGSGSANSSEETTNQNDTKPSDKSEGLPGYLTDPEMLTAVTNESFLDVTGSAGTIKQKDGKVQQVPIRIGVVTKAELEKHIGKALDQIVVRATQVKTEYVVQPDGSFKVSLLSDVDDIVVLSLLPAMDPANYSVKNPPEGVSVMYRDPAVSEKFRSLESYYLTTGSSAEPTVKDDQPLDPEPETPPASTIPCNGTIVGDSCWYLAPRNVSCQDFCAGNGGYSEETRLFAGSDGSDENCTKVLDGLGVGLGEIQPWSDCGGGCGIGTVNQYRRRDTNPTTPECKINVGRRACACLK